MRHGATVPSCWTGCTCGVDRFCPKSGPVSRSRPSKPVQQQPVIFLGQLAFWTGWTGRTGFQGEGSPRACANRAARGADALIEQRRVTPVTPRLWAWCDSGSVP
jgi:hypothetical protein